MMEIDGWNPTCDGALSESVGRAKLERQGYQVSCSAHPPGTCFPNHTHAMEMDKDKDKNKIDAVKVG
jgi:hypothetical protein